MLTRWKFSFAVLSILVIALPMYALDVDQDELSATSRTSVEFINYEGPHDRIDTIEQIIGVGRALARATKDRSGSATIAGKYRITHSVSPSDSPKLDADIFYLLSPAEVDHIVNLRRIMAGYLEVAYSYDIADALLLAEFISVYNAVYRGRFSYFQEHYKNPVIEYLTPDSVGLATVYSKWPGDTQIVIPLSDRATSGGFGSLDSDALTEDEVIEELREREDQGIPIRKDITELKEREVEAAQREIDDERDSVAEERERIERERQKVEEERQNLENERDDAKEASDDDAAEKIDEQQTELDEQEKTLEEESAALDEKEAELDEREEEQAKRIERIQEEREQIATEERALLDDEKPDGATAGLGGLGAEGGGMQAVLFLKTRSDETSGSTFSQLVYIEQATNTIIAQSSTNTIRGRRIYDFAESLLVIAGDSDDAELSDDSEAASDDDNGSARAVKLVLIDRETLDTIAESSEPVSQDSWIAIESPETFVTTYNDGEGWLVGRFDATLSLVRGSSVNVDPLTMIQIGEKLIYVQDAEGQIIGLDPAGLEPARELE